MPTNIAITGEIYGNTTTGPVLESGSVALSNPAESGKVLRVSSLLIANTTGSANADVIVSVRRGGVEGSSSIYFDGASSLTVANNAGLSFSGNFTIEAFIYLNSNGNYAGILDTRSGGGNGNYLFGVRNNSYQRLVWIDSVNGERNSDAPIFFNRWTHVAVVKDGSSIYFYIDGVRDTLVTTSSSSVSATTSTPLIGRIVDPGQWTGGYFNGFMEEIRVSDTARYTTATFSVPTSPFANNHVNSKLLLHGDGEHNSDTFTNSVLTPATVTRTGNTKISTARSVFAGQDTRISQGITVPAGGTLCVLEKAIYLEEGDRLVCSASTNSRLEYTCSYEEIA